MHTVHIVARVVLGAIFVFAGGSKVANGRAWFEQALGLGVPRSVAVVVPWLELIVGALVVVGVAEPWPATIALVMLIAFTVEIVRTMRQGRRPPCACFGTFSAKPIGWSHVARNVGFAALAVLAMTTH